MKAKEALARKKRYIKLHQTAMIGSPKAQELARGDMSECEVW